MNNYPQKQTVRLVEDHRVVLTLWCPFFLSLEHSESSGTVEMGWGWVLRRGGLAPCSRNCCLGEQRPPSHGAGASGGAAGTGSSQNSHKIITESPWTTTESQNGLGEKGPERFSYYSVSIRGLYSSVLFPPRCLLLPQSCCHLQSSALTVLNIYPGSFTKCCMAQTQQLISVIAVKADLVFWFSVYSYN